MIILVQLHRENAYWNELLAIRNRGLDSGEEWSPGEILPEYRELYEMNSDMVGWLNISGLQIDWSVMQTKEDPEYYLWRAFNGLEGYLGPPFVDYRCSVFPRRSFNLIVYGHYSTDERLFGRLPYYAIEMWGRANDIRFDTLEEKGVYKVVAVFYYDAEGAVLNEPDANEGENAYTFYNYIELDSKKGFEQFLKNLKKQNLYEKELDITPEDELLTIVCCVPEEQAQGMKDGRFVVVAKKVQKEV